jgi:UPF0755 protein
VTDINPLKLPVAMPKKRRASAVVRVLAWLLGLGVIGAGGAGLAAVWGYAAYSSPGPLPQAVIVNIPRGLSAGETARLLADKGVVGDAMVMGTASVVQSLRGAIPKAGEFEFPAHVSMAEAFNIMAAGKFYMYKLTVPEGWTTEMALQRFREQEPMAGEVTAALPEAAVIANTYLYPRGTARQKLLDEMVAAQKKLVEEVWATKPADTILKSPEEMVTLASIVEKETAKPDERPRVAAVFVNRLKAGMRLQSDPTIIYGLVGGKGKLDHPITQSELESDTPYNTYRINGLPPGPIATPGRDSMEAVLHPAATNDLYFVADGTGGHVFAATLEEHNANVQKWRKIEDGSAAPAPAPAQAPAVAAATPAEPAPSQMPEIAETAPADTDGSAAPPADAAVDAAVKTRDAMTKVPDPGTAAAKPDAQTAEAATTPEAASIPKPGTLVKVGKVLVPIPKLKPATP